jgi:hypothetical protein
MSGCSKYPCRWLTESASQIDGNEVSELNDRGRALVQIHVPNVVYCLTNGDPKTCPYNEDRVLAEYIKEHLVQ